MELALQNFRLKLFFKALLTIVESPAGAYITGHGTVLFLVFHGYCAQLNGLILKRLFLFFHSEVQLHGPDVLWRPALFIPELQGMQGNCFYIEDLFLQPPLCNPFTARPFPLRCFRMCAVDCSVCYSISQQAWLVSPPCPSLFNLPSLSPVMVRYPGN